MHKIAINRLAQPFSRRTFLRSTGLAAAVFMPTVFSSTAAGNTTSEMKLRPDLLDEDSPPGLEIVQLTADASVPASHLYMEAQIFTISTARLPKC